MLTREQFEGVYSELWRYVYSVCYALLGRREDAEDAAQEVFVRKWRVRERYDPSRATVKSWLCVNAARVCTDFVRRGRVRQVREVELVGGEAEGGRSDGGEGAADVDSCLRRLSIRQRQALVMRGVLGFTWEEIGLAMGVSVSRARRLVREATEQMRRCLEG